MAKKPESPSPSVRALIARVGREIRQVGAQSVITSQIVAGRFGMHTSDLECLDLVYLRGSASAGELASATGLTTGATTALIDRLERAGFVERVPDATDRRRVQVRIRAAAIAPIKAVYAPMQRKMFALWSQYSARELAVIADFLARSRALSIDCTAAIQRDAPPRAKQRSRRQRASMANRDEK